jgi:hypothetical protein
MYQLMPKAAEIPKPKPKPPPPPRPPRPPAPPPGLMLAVLANKGDAKAVAQSEILKAATISSSDRVLGVQFQNHEIEDGCEGYPRYKCRRQKAATLSSR